MYTFMTNDAFSKLKSIRDTLLSDAHEGVGGIFVPWAGGRLLNGGGIYYVGQATADGFYENERQTFAACYERTAEMCNGKSHDRSGTPFWQFLDGLTTELLGGHYNATTDRWGWSNLLKIACTSGTPERSSVLFNRQSAACAACLQLELYKLKEALIFIASADTFDIFRSADTVDVLDHMLLQSAKWSKDSQEAGIYWWWDESAQNLYVHGYHPGYARRSKIFSTQLKSTIRIAQRYIPWRSKD